MLELITARGSEDERQFVLRQTIYRRQENELREFGKRGETINEDRRNYLHFLYRNGRLHFGDDSRTRVNLVAEVRELYRKA